MALRTKLSNYTYQASNPPVVQEHAGSSVPRRRALGLGFRVERRSHTMVTASANYAQTSPYIQTSTVPLRSSSSAPSGGAVGRRRQSSSLPMVVFEQSDVRYNRDGRVENNRRPRLRAVLELTLCRGSRICGPCVAARPHAFLEGPGCAAHCAAMMHRVAP